MQTPVIKIISCFLLVVAALPATAQMEENAHTTAFTFPDLSPALAMQHRNDTGMAKRPVLGYRIGR
jgi:hypothetical protein